MTQLVDDLLPENLSVMDANGLESLFVFAVVWSLGANLHAEERERFSKAIREQASIILPQSSTLYEYFYELKDKVFYSWDSKLSEESMPADAPVHSILIPTTDTVKYTFLLSTFEQKGGPVLFSGDPGTAKTVIIQNYLKKLDLETRAVVTLNFSSRTSSLEVQRNIESLCDKRRPGLYCPRGGKKLVVFVDELHMPQKDKYGTQQPIALLRFLVDKGFMYERGGQLEKRKFLDIRFVGALLPPSGGFNKVDARLLSLFNCLGIAFPS